MSSLFLRSSIWGKKFFQFFFFFLASASREISFEDRQCRVHSLRSCKYKKIIIFFSAFAFMVVSLEDNAVSLHQGKVNETFFILSFFCFIIFRSSFFLGTKWTILLWQKE